MAHASEKGASKLCPHSPGAFLEAHGMERRREQEGLQTSGSISDLSSPYIQRKDSDDENIRHPHHEALNQWHKHRRRMWKTKQGSQNNGKFLSLSLEDKQTNNKRQKLPSL
jgi:hypothetical protein